MDAFELNKIAGAVLFAALIFFGIGAVSEAMFAPGHLEQSAYIVEGLDDDDGGDVEVAAPVPIATLLATADAGAGEKVAKKCASCHKFEKGGANGTGPALWDVVGRDVAAVGDFSYSDAMGGFEGDWSYDVLNDFLLNPKAAMPGTKMAYKGLKKDADRANLIAYLRTLSDDPIALPEPPAQEAAAEEAPAEETTASD